MREQRLQRMFDGATMVAAIVTLPVVAALGLDPSEPLRTILMTVNCVLWGTFVLELVVMLVVSKDRGAWLQRRPLTPVIVVLTPPAYIGLDLFRLVRLLRGHLARRIANTATTTEGLRDLALLTLLTVGLGGALFSVIEPDMDSGDGVYWAVTTVTTLGYGDVVPTTSEGKVLAIFVMVVGALFLAILTAAAAERFVNRLQGSRDPARDPYDDAVLTKLDELGDRLAALERAVDRRPGAGP